MTKEERSQRAKQRIEERAREEAEWERLHPSARLSSHDGDHKEWIQIVLDNQVENYIEIRVMGDPFRLERPSEPGYEVRMATIHMNHDLAETARLIRGLTLRYNAMVKQMNNWAEATPPLETAKLLDAKAKP